MIVMEDHSRLPGITKITEYLPFISKKIYPTDGIQVQGWSNDMAASICIQRHIRLPQTSVNNAI